MADVDAVGSVELASGAEMPLLGFGTWQLTRQQAYRSVLTALDTGYRHLDTATVYGNEREVGGAVQQSGVARSDLFVVTKIPPERLGRERETIEASLDALSTDYVDLWLVHWPPRRAAQSVAMLQRMLELRDEGLVRDVGVSNYDLGEIDRIAAEIGEAPAVNQIPWAPSLFDAELLAASRRRGVVVEGYSPFNKTDLSNPVLVDVARAHGVSAAQVVLRWHLQHRVVVIPRSSNAGRIAENFDVLGFELSAVEMQTLDALDR
jgi:2,5-diketo-D-gluconate reductase A